MSTASAAPARLRAKYNDEVRASLKDELGLKSIMQVPVLQKVTVNMGVGDAKQDRKILENATQQLAQITGQQPNPRRARKSIANFKLREEMVVGVSVTLRHDRAFEFIDRVVSVALPRLRDFSGLKRTSFDGRGNYSFGIKEQVIFPEIDYDKIDQTRGMDITITTSANTDAEALALLTALGLPFTKENRQNG
jgi:large subunit ribosomal protein L5